MGRRGRLAQRDLKRSRRLLDSGAASALLSLGATMSELLILKALRERDAKCAEHRYLLSLCRLEAERVYDRVELCTIEAGSSCAALDGADVLAIGAANVFLGHHSLGRMRARLREGCQAVWPYRLAETAIAAEAPLYTLRGYEEMERRFLRVSPPQGRASDSHLPICLLAPGLAGELVRDHGVEALLADPYLLPESVLGGRLARDGLYHELADYYGQVRSDVLPFVPAAARDVLEVGCGSGGTGAFLQERLGCRVTGVELNPLVAAEARAFLHRLIAGDVMDVDLGGPYDAVLALDVFEHLAAPDEFLAKLRRVVRPGGRIVLSVPNVGHYSVVTDLLAGRFDYVPIGLLCYTHLRFYTRHTLDDWLRRCRFSRFEIIPQITELPEPFACGGVALEYDRESLRTKGFWVVVDL